MKILLNLLNGFSDMEIDTKEVEALVRLLDDPDNEVALNVENRLLFLGNEVIGYLEDAWEKSFDALLQQKLESVIHKIQYESVKSDLRAWKEGGAENLLKGVLIVNRYQYPDLKEQKIENLLEEIRRDAWMQMTYEMTPAEKVKILNHIFYRVHKFSGNTANYQDPQNSYLNLVLESKKGNQISLAIIYSMVAQRLGIPVFGVNLPQHFILAYMSGATDPAAGQGAVEPSDYPAEIDETLNQQDGIRIEELSITEPASDTEPVPGETDGPEDEVLFYINAFNKGFIFSRKEVDYFLKQLNLKQRKEFYLPCTSMDIVKRIIRNLVGSYEKLGYELKVRELLELADILEEGNQNNNEREEG